MKAEKIKRVSYTLEYKLEAVQLVQCGQSCTAIAKVLGMPSQPLENWVQQAAEGQLTGAGAKSASRQCEVPDVSTLAVTLNIGGEEFRMIRRFPASASATLLR